MAVKYIVKTQYSIVVSCMHFFFDHTLAFLPSTQPSIINPRNSSCLSTCPIHSFFLFMILFHKGSSFRYPFKYFLVCYHIRPTSLKNSSVTPHLKTLLLFSVFLWQLSMFHFHTALNSIPTYVFRRFILKRRYAYIFWNKKSSFFVKWYLSLAYSLYYFSFTSAIFTYYASQICEFFYLLYCLMVLQMYFWPNFLLHTITLVFFILIFMFSSLSRASSTHLSILCNSSSFSAITVISSANRSISIFPPFIFRPKCIFPLIMSIASWFYHWIW